MKYTGRIYLINAETEPTIIQVQSHTENRVDFTLSSFVPSSKMISKSGQQFMEESAFSKFVKKGKVLTEDEADNLYRTWTGQKEIVNNPPFPIPNDEHFVGKWYWHSTEYILGKITSVKKSKYVVQNYTFDLEKSKITKSKETLSKQDILVLEEEALISKLNEEEALIVLGTWEDKEKERKSKSKDLLVAKKQISLDSKEKFLSLCEGKKKFYLLNGAIYRPTLIKDNLVHLEPILPTHDFVELTLSQLFDSNFLTKEEVNALGQKFGEVQISDDNGFNKVEIRSVDRLQPNKWCDFKDLPVLASFFDEDLYANVKVSNRDYVDALTGNRSKCTKSMKVYPLNQVLVF